MASQPEHHPAPFDVAIVGAGLAGSAAAATLGRAGNRVVLVDRHAEYPPEFRAEQVVGEQVDALRRLDLFDAIAQRARPVGRVLNARDGRLVDITEAEHHGIAYDEMVAGIRAALPPAVALHVGRVAAIETSADRQRVHLGRGVPPLEARLVVLATGFGAALRDGLGIRRRVLRDAHSLTLGFDLVPEEGEDLPPAFTYYGSRPSQRVDYLSVFPMRDAMRGNLFAYRTAGEDWTREFRDAPDATLRASLPGVERFLGAARAVGPVQIRVNDLYRVEDPVRDGVVLVGDAFQSSCPAAGTGIGRLLTDVERLCTTYVPAWLATSGMGAAKVAAFYADPVKTAVDARALHIAEYRRRAATETGMRWSLHRRRVLLQRRLRDWMGSMSGSRAAIQAAR